MASRAADKRGLWATDFNVEAETQWHCVCHSTSANRLPANADAGDHGEVGNRVTYPGYTRRADLTTLLDGASDRRLTLVTLVVVMAAYEAALDRHSWRHENGCSQQHYLRYLDTLGYTLCDVERLAAGLQPLTNDHEDNRDDKHDEQNQED